jgi:hypothetical protein
MSDMKRLIEKMDQFAGQAVGQKPGDQVRGIEKAKKSKGNKHPFAGRLVGASESKSLLADLEKELVEGAVKRSLAEEFAEFKEATMAPQQVAAAKAAAPYGYNTQTGKPNPAPAAQAQPAAPAKPATTTPAAPANPEQAMLDKIGARAGAAPGSNTQQVGDAYERKILDRLGKRFGLPPGSTAEQVQAAQQAYLDKNDPAAAAQYKQNMGNIDADNTAATKPVELTNPYSKDNAAAAGAQVTGQPAPAPTAQPTAPAATATQDPNFAAGLAAQKAGGSPIDIMLAQPGIAGNQQLVDAIGSVYGLPPGSTVEQVKAAASGKPAAPAAPAQPAVAESRVQYNKKTGQMGVDNSDPDQRHGLYINGKLVKTVNGAEAANNLKKRDPRFKDATVKKIAEGLTPDGEFLSKEERVKAGDKVYYKGQFVGIATGEKAAGKILFTPNASYGTDKNVASLPSSLVNLREFTELEIAIMEGGNSLSEGDDDMFSNRRTDPLDEIWRKIENVVGQIYPDGDPIDYLGPWIKQKGYPYSMVDAACKKNGYDDVYAYWDSMSDDLGYGDSFNESDDMFADRNTQKIGMAIIDAGKGMIEDAPYRWEGDEEMIEYTRKDGRDMIKAGEAYINQGMDAGNEALWDLDTAVRDEAYDAVLDIGIDLNDLWDLDEGTVIAFPKRKKLPQAAKPDPTEPKTNNVKAISKDRYAKTGPRTMQGPTMHSVYEDEESFGYKSLHPEIFKARQQFPMAKSDMEALLMYVQSQEEHDIKRVDRVNDREDAEIDQLGKEENSLERRLETLSAQLEKLKAQAKTVKEEVPAPVATAGGPAGANQPKTTPGATPQVDPAQQALLKQNQAKMQQNLANLKSAGVQIDPAKAAQTLQKTDTGAPMNAMDKDNIAAMAPAIGNVMANPQTATQLNTLIKKAGGGV